MNAIDAALITEHRDGLATLALNNELFEPLAHAERESLLRMIVRFGCASLRAEIEETSDEEPVRLRPARDETSCVLQLRLIVTPTGGFSLAVDFGSAVDPGVSQREALEHALAVLNGCAELGG